VKKYFGVVMTDAPIIVISYDEPVIQSLEAALAKMNVPFVACRSFVEAEDRMRTACCNGILVDLTAMVRAKAEEKIVACTLTNFFPTLRVRVMGSMLIPMALPGQSSQDKSLNDFISKSCEQFVPRRMRAHKRKDIFIPLLLTTEDGRVSDLRCCTLNVSWGGMFVIDTSPEKYRVGDLLSLRTAESGISINTRVVGVNEWAQKRMPGIRLEFLDIGYELEKILINTLRVDRHADRDRVS
jgi:hypothetical protein